MHCKRVRNYLKIMPNTELIPLVVGLTIVLSGLVGPVLGLGAQVTGTNQVSSVKDDDDGPYKLEWIGEPEMNRTYGQEKQVSSVVYTGDQSNDVAISKDYSHSYDARHGYELDLGGLIDSIGIKYTFHMSHSKGNKSTLSHKITMDKRSKGIVLFRENLITLKGKARKTYEKSFWCHFRPSITAVVAHPNCYKKPEVVDIEVTSTELDESGNVIGTYSVQYQGTDKYKHPGYYHVLNRHTDTSGALQVSETTEVKSPHHCAELASESEKYSALYDVSEMKCYLLDVIRHYSKDKAKDGENYDEKDSLYPSSTFDKDGHLIGDFWPAGSDDPDIFPAPPVTRNPLERNHWKKAKKCDLILQEYVESEKDKSQRELQYVCKKFEEKQNSVILFKRLHKESSSVLGVPKSHARPKEAAEREPTKSTRRPAAAAGPESGTPVAVAGGAGKPADPKPAGPKKSDAQQHPKFYQLNGRQLAPSVGAQNVRNVASAYDCGEQAIGSEKFLAIYRPNERLCILEPIQWNYGRSFTSTGTPLGPYGIRTASPGTARVEIQTDDGEKRQQWFNDGATCDVVHDTDEGVFTCKNFDRGDNSVILLRHIDGYEAKRINRAHRIRENDRLLFAGSQHPSFYSIKDKDFPLKCVKTQAGISSAQACGDLAIENGKYLAVYKPTANVCILKEVESGYGQTSDRWNKPLGAYDIPFYDKESSQSNKDFERWQDLNECDLIHTKKDDGWRFCKQFPTTDDSILLFRRM